MEGNEDLKSKTISGLIWRYAERCAAQLVSFIVSIILARLLTPNDYGLIAIVTIFITISQVFIDSGLGNALIQKKDADEVDFSSVFYTNILICSLIYILLFFLSPVIANFYNSPQLTTVIRILGIVVIISGVKNVQQAYVSKNMLFKKFFWSTLIGTIVSAIAGIIMAYKGFGVWALVTQQLVNVSIDTCILWITVKWRPKLAFSLKKLKKLYSFGWKLFLSSLINTIYDNLRQLIIGKIYTSSDLAFYNRGKQFPHLIVSNINTTIDSVLLPAMSSKQDEKSTVKNMTRRSIKISSYIMWPMMIGLACIANPLIILLMTDKWIPAVPFLQVFCIIFAFQPIQTANLNAIQALGRSDIFLKLELIKKTIGILILILTLNFGIYAILFGMLAYTIIASIINAYPNKKLLNYSYIEQIKDIFPSIFLSLIMALFIYPINFIKLPNYLIIMIQVLLGIIIYIVVSYIIKEDSFYYILNTIKKFKNKISKKIISERRN